MIPYIKTHRENKYNLASIQELRKRSSFGLLRYAEFTLA